MVEVLDPWWRDALCAEVGIDLFFTQVGDQAAEAREVCAMCDVRLDCLADSLRFDGEDADGGIFGGFGTHERRRLRVRVLNGEDRHDVAAAAIHQEQTKRKKAS